MTKPISTGHVTETVTTCGVGTASGDAPENAGDKIAKFMSRVVPWPTNGSGYIGLHWHLPGSPFRGRSVSTVDEFLSAMETVAVTNSNIYFCLSQQAIKDARSAKTATYLKAIWLDVDVKAPPKGYATLEEAYEAVTAFVKQYNLPAPSAVVQSGGGLHVYWISNRPLSVSEWHPYALGLKSAAQAFGLRCDAGITVDAARVLRVPGTKNFKTTPPRPVKYAGGDTDYDFAADLTALRSLTPPVVASQTTNGSPPPNGKLSAGVKGEFPPLDPKPIFKGCPWLLNALRTAGRDYDQPQWHLSTLCATFMENGHDIAHQMGNQHPGYSRGTTDSLWERKYRDRADKGIGWPSCRAIQDAGSRFCEGCSHFAKGKSPLNLALPTARADQKSTVGPTVQSKINPVAALMSLRDQGANEKELLLAMNQSFAVAKYGSKIVVASIVGKELDFMKHDDFHNMLANLVIQKEIEIKDDSGTPQKTTRAITVSKHWFKSKHRRQYVGRGVVFEPNGPLEIPNDMLNLWRGFGVEPKQGDWSLMRNHIQDVICSGNEEHFQYLIRWMAYGIQHPDRPIGVAIALRGEEGAGKGFLWRNYGKLFGKHFKHVAHGEHLTGRFNAVLAETCAVFLDEALWAGDHKGEQILKALITEETFQLERKNYDPIPVKNRLRVMIASNNQWLVPVGTRGRRYCVLDASNKYANEKSPEHKAYWEPLQAQFGDDAPDDGRGAMLYDLLHMDLRGFNVRAVPDSAAKTEQKLLSLRGTEAWLYHVLQEGRIGEDMLKEQNGSFVKPNWDRTALTVSKDCAYAHYEDFSKGRREWQPEIKDLWSKNIHRVLGPNVEDIRPTIDKERVRSFKFAPLAECRRQFKAYIHAPNIEWEPANAPEPETDATVRQTADDLGDPTVSATVDDAPSIERETELAPENWPEHEPEYEPDCSPEYEPANERESD